MNWYEIALGVVLVAVSVLIVVFHPRAGAEGPGPVRRDHGRKLRHDGSRP